MRPMHSKTATSFGRLVGNKRMSQTEINNTGRFAGVFVTSKLTPIIILSFFVLGVIALLMTPREENPQIIVPAADVTVMLPGASAEEVESLVLTPLEKVLSEIPGVDHTFGVAFNSFARVTVQFEVGEDKEDSLLKLYDRVTREQHRLPAGSTVPEVRPLDVDDVPIVVVTLASSVYDDYALKRIADRFAERLQSFKSVSLVNVYGGRDREVRIELDPGRLQAFGVTVDQVQKAIAASNIAAPIGRVAEQNELSTVFVAGHLETIDALESLIVYQVKGRPIYLRDIADVFDSPPSERGEISRFSYGRADPRFTEHHGEELAAVSIAIAKKTGTNAVTVERDVLERIERLRQQLLPKDIHLVVTRQDGSKANAAVNGLMSNLGISVISVFLVLLVSLGWREATIVALVVPLVLALTLAGSWFAGITINRVTLFGLILSLGLLVDAAIVVVENIYRHFQLNPDGNKREIILSAVSEIANPTNLATLSVMLVFGALVNVSGMPGQYFTPITFSVPFAMAASLLVAYIVAPWGAAILPLKTRAASNNGSGGGNSKIHRAYRSLISLLLRRRMIRWVAYLILFTLMGAALMQPIWQFVRPSGVLGPQSYFGVEMGLMPKDDKNTFKIEIEMPENSLAEQTDRIAREIEVLVATNRFVANYQTWIGHKDIPDFNGLLRGSVGVQAPNVADIRVNLSNKLQRRTTSMEVVRELRDLVGPISKRHPNASIRFVEDPPGPPVRATLFAELYGQDRYLIRELAFRVAEEFESTYDVVDVFDTEPTDVSRYEIDVDKEKAALSGVSTASIASILRVLFSGETVGRLHAEGEKNVVPIRLLVPRRYELNPENLHQVFVTNTDGRPVPVSELIKVSKTHEDLVRFHKDNERVTFVGAELSTTAPIYAIIDLTKRLGDIQVGLDDKLDIRNLTLQPERPDTTDGVSLFWGGEIRLTLDNYRDMTSALIVALLLTFLLLVAYYQSFKIPLVAMAAVPFGLVGIFPGHWLLDTTFSATSMIGIIALAGVVVRNALLIIDFVRDNLRAGMPLNDALCEAGAVRLKPIMLTTITIMFGSAVMIPDPVFGGLAIALIFGSFASTILTLIFIPLIFEPIARAQERKIPPTLAEVNLE
jgi:multidrug efflux pump subunit AcrB